MPPRNAQRIDTQVAQWLRLDESDPQQRLALDLARGDRDFLNQLVDHRRRLRLTQEQVAVRMGVSQSAVSQLEAGDRDPQMSTLRRYALALGLRIEHRVVVEDSLRDDQAERIREAAIRSLEPRHRPHVTSGPETARDLLAASGALA